MLKNLILLSLVTSCGVSKTENNRVYSEDGSSCAVNQLDHGAEIVCEDGSRAIISNGSDGQDGIDGTSCQVSSVEEGVVVTCGSYEQTIFNGQDGTDGTNGVDGVDGADGKNGKSYKSKLLYEGYACGRTVVSLNGTFYVISGQLIELSKKWMSVSNSCEVRIKNKKIQTR